MRAEEPGKSRFGDLVTAHFLPQSHEFGAFSPRFLDSLRDLTARPDAVDLWRRICLVVEDIHKLEAAAIILFVPKHVDLLPQRQLQAPLRQTFGFARDYLHRRLTSPAYGIFRASV